jgi:hypothetical protein
MTKLSGDGAVLFVAGFTTKTIQQSTVAGGALNTISVTFQLNRDFSYESAPAITVSGLTGTKMPTNQPFPVDAFRFSDLWRSDGPILQGGTRILARLSCMLRKSWLKARCMTSLLCSATKTWDKSLATAQSTSPNCSRTSSSQHASTIS